MCFVALYTRVYLPFKAVIISLTLKYTFKTFARLYRAIKGFKSPYAHGVQFARVAFCVFLLSGVLACFIKYDLLYTFKPNTFSAPVKFSIQAFGIRVLCKFGARFRETVKTGFCPQILNIGGYQNTGIIIFMADPQKEILPRPKNDSIYQYIANAPLTRQI